MAQRRSDKANYIALLVVGIVLLVVSGMGEAPLGMVLGLIALAGAGFYYWKTEKADEG